MRFVHVYISARDAILGKVRVCYCCLHLVQCVKTLRGRSAKAATKPKEARAAEAGTAAAAAASAAGAGIYEAECGSSMVVGIDLVCWC